VRAVRITVPARFGAGRISGDTWAVLVSAVLAIAIGASVATNPIAAVLPIGLMGAVLLTVDARARLLFLVFGGLLTLQSSNSFGSLKLVYLAGVFACLGGALMRFAQSEDWFRRAQVRPLMRVSALMCALIVISLLVAEAHSVRRTDWLRDVAPYVLFATVPIFALDAQWALSRQTLVRILVLAGVVATVSFATHWLEARSIAQLPFSKFALSSFYFPTALFTFAVASALHSNRRRAQWALLAIGVFALMVVTGTRTTLILAVVPLVAVFSARRRLSSRFLRLAVAGPVALVLMVGGAFGVIAATHGSTTIISDRITILEHSGTSKDASYLDRKAQTHAAAVVFRANPIFGAGPGTLFNWNETNGTPHSEFILDSPVDFAAKFGVLGLAVVGFLVMSYAAFLRSSVGFEHPRPETLALLSYAVVAVAGSYLATPFEDKGFTLGLILLLALLFRTWERQPAAGHPRSPGVVRP
jgi:hypothetical protein